MSPDLVDWVQLPPALVPGEGFKDLFGRDERMPYSVPANLTLTY